jgi:Ca2+-transporting ATPase
MTIASKDAAIESHFVNRPFSASLVTAFRRPKPALALVLLAVTTMLGLTLPWPFASGLFRFGPLHVDDLALTLAAAILVLVVLEVLKLLSAGRPQSPPNRSVSKQLRLRRFPTLMCLLP